MSCSSFIRSSGVITERRGELRFPFHLLNCRCEWRIRRNVRKIWLLESEQRFYIRKVRITSFAEQVHEFCYGDESLKNQKLGCWCQPVEAHPERLDRCWDLRLIFLVKGCLAQGKLWNIGFSQASDFYTVLLDDVPKEGEISPILFDDPKRRELKKWNEMWQTLAIVRHRFNIYNIYMNHRKFYKPVSWWGKGSNSYGFNCWRLFHYTISDY